MDNSSFIERTDNELQMEQLYLGGSTSDTFRIRKYGKLHFLKRLKKEYSDRQLYQAAFRKEFEVGYGLEHPNLVRYLSTGKEGILMEYVDGGTLSSFVGSHPNYFDNRKRLDKFIMQILDVMQYLHEHHVLHLDIKPDNILITRIDHDVKLIDLGGVYTDCYDDTIATTLNFADPILINIGKDKNTIVDERSDIYSLGRVLQMLPLPKSYRRVVDKCTKENPQDRYSCVSDIRNDFKSAKKQRKTYLLLCSVVLILVTFFLLSLFIPKTVSNKIDVENKEDVVSSVDSKRDTAAMQSNTKKDSIKIEKSATTKISLENGETDGVLRSVAAEETINKLTEEEALIRLRSDIEVAVNKIYKETMAYSVDSFYYPTLFSIQVDQFSKKTMKLQEKIVQENSHIPKQKVIDEFSAIVTGKVKSTLDTLQRKYSQ